MQLTWHLQKKQLKIKKIGDCILSRLIKKVLTSLLELIFLICDFDVQFNQQKNQLSYSSNFLFSFNQILL